MSTLSDLNSGWQWAPALAQLSAKFGCFSPPDGDEPLQHQCCGCLCAILSGGQICLTACLGDEMEVQWAMPHSQQYFKQITPFSSIWILSKGTYTLCLHVKVLSSFSCVYARAHVQERENISPSNLKSF